MNSNDSNAVNIKVKDFLRLPDSMRRNNAGILEVLSSCRGESAFVPAIIIN